MKKIALLIGLGSIIITSCSDKKRKPSIVYMPDMYYATAYDPYQKATFGYPHDEENSEVPVFSKNHNMSALESVEGAVSRTDGDILPWPFKNNNAGFAEAKKVTSAPLNAANKATDLERGKLLFHQNCAVCHGDAGDGQGSIVKSKAFSGVPNYSERDLTVGSVYHVIMYGKNAMGSYASQMTPADRWRVAEYVMSLKGGESKEAAPAASAEPAKEASEEATK